MKTRKVPRRSRKATSRRHRRRAKGGAIIGEGGFGIVHMPPLKCLVGSNANTNANKKYSTGNYISKLTAQTEAVKELTVSNVIRERVKNWSKFCCLVDHICEYDPKQVANNNANHAVNNGEAPRNYIAISLYGGIPLYDIYEFINNNEIDKILKPSSLKNIPAKRLAITNLLSAIGNFIGYVHELHKMRVYHRDISINNILYDIYKNQLNLIDYGRSHVYDLGSQPSETTIDDQLDDLHNLLSSLYRIICTIVKSRILDTPPNQEYHLLLQKWFDVGINDDVKQIVIQSRRDNANNVKNNDTNGECMSSLEYMRVEYVSDIGLITQDLNDLKNIIDLYTP